MGLRLDRRHDDRCQARGRHLTDAFLDDGDLDVVDWRQRVEHAVPLFATVTADPELAGRGAEVQRGRGERVDGHAVAQHREVGVLLGETLRQPAPGVAAVLAAPDGWRAARARARRGLERHHVHRVGVVRMDDDREPEVRGQPLGDRSPGLAVVVAAQHADVGPRPARARPVGPAAVVLHVKPPRRGGVTSNLVHALAELGVGVGSEPGTDALVGRPERDPAVVAHVVAAGGNPHVKPLAIADDRVQAEAAVAWLPLARVLVVAQAFDHLPRVAGVTTPEQRGRFDAAEQSLAALARLERPDVGERTPVVLGKGRGRLGFLEGLAEVRGAQHLHAEEGIAARGVEPRRAARVDQCGVHGNTVAEGPGQGEFPTALRGLRHEDTLLRANGDNDSLCHLQPPETAGRNVTTSPGSSAVSRPSRSRM